MQRAMYALTVLAVALGAAHAQATLIANWNFNDSNLLVDGGDGGTHTLSHDFDDGASYGTGDLLNAVGSDPAGNALRFLSKNKNGKIATFAIDTTGYEDIIFTYATVGDGNSTFTTQTIAYSTNGGGSFTDVSPAFSPSTSYSLATFNFSSVAALDNNANAQFRITFSGAGNANNQYNLLDNVQFNGTSPTPLNDSMITAPASVDFGKMLVGYDASAQNIDLTKTGNQATTYTATPANNGVSVTADGNIAGGTQSESISTDLATNANGSGTSGSKSIAVTIDNTAASSSTAGKGSDDADDMIQATAEVYQSGSPTANTSGPQKANGDLATITNAASTDGGQRASVVLDDFSVTGDGWSVSGLVAATTQTGATTTASASFDGTVHFDSTGKLNGRHRGTLSMYLENDQSLLGAADRDLNGGNAFVWQLAETVSGNNGNQSSKVKSGDDLGDLNVPLSGTSDQGGGTTATLLDGTVTADRTIMIGNWRVASGSEFGGEFVSDVFTLSGTNGDTIVLSANYNESLLTDDETTLAAAGELYLGWRNGLSQWVNAVDGNTGGVANLILDAYNAAYFSLGNYGVDTVSNTVWAVINHNSEFGALNEVNQQDEFDAASTPEPASFALAILALFTVGMTRRRRHQQL